MYEWWKRIVLALLKVEDKKPQPLPGHREGDFLEIVRACPAFWDFQLLTWRIYLISMVAIATFLSCIFLLVNPLTLLVIIPVWILLAIKAALIYMTMRLDYEMRWYVITDRSVLIREGAMDVREICLTFANAQNVFVRQGPLERWFGFSNVEINTAGGSAGPHQGGVQSHQAVLRGVSNAEHLRDLILLKLKQHRTAGLGDPDDHEHHDQKHPALNPVLVKEILDEARQLRKVLETSNLS